MKAREVSDWQMFAAIKKYLRAEERAEKIVKQLARLKQEEKKVADEINRQINNFFERMIAHKLTHGGGAPVIVFSGKEQLKVDLHICEDCGGCGQDPSGVARALRRDMMCFHCFRGSGVVGITITDNGQIVRKRLPDSGFRRF